VGEGPALIIGTAGFRANMCDNFILLPLKELLRTAVCLQAANSTSEHSQPGSIAHGTENHAAGGCGWVLPGLPSKRAEESAK